MAVVCTVFISLIGALPLSVRFKLAQFIGLFVSYLPTREHQVAKLQLKYILKHNNYRQLVSQVYQNICIAIAESINLAPLLNNYNNHIQLNDPEDLTSQRMYPERPAIILTGHTGNWDLMAAYFAARGIPITTIGRPAKKPWQQKILEKLRSANGVHTIWRGAGMSETRQIIEVLKSNNLIAVLIDQDLNMPGIASTFFDRFVKAPHGLIELGKKYNVQFITCFNTRTAPLKYQIDVASIANNLSTEEILNLYHQRLEQTIRKNPGQWVWIHKRWRSTSLKKTLSTAQYLKHLRHLGPLENENNHTA